MFKSISVSTEQEWLDLRRKGIGGSDAGAILGVNPFKSPLELWLEKTGRVEPEDISGKEAVEWGTRLESPIAMKFADEHPEYSVTETHATYISEERPFMHANIDRELQDLKTGQLGILEVKTAGARSDKDWVFGPPEHYLAQVTHYLAVTGYGFAWIAVLIGGQEYREFRIERDEEDISILEEREEIFWNMVLDGTLPELVGVKGEAKALATIYPESDGEHRHLSDIDHPEIFELFQLQADKKALEARINDLGAHIRALIGDSKGVETESMRVTWVRGPQRRFDQTLFREENPEMYEDYKTESIRDGGLKFSPAKE